LPTAENADAGLAFSGIPAFTYFSSTASSIDVQGVPLSTTSIVNVLGVFQSIPCSVDVQGV
jgi:hypothetical protein